MSEVPRGVATDKTDPLLPQQCLFLENLNIHHAPNKEKAAVAKLYFS